MLHVGQERVLLSFVEAVDLIDEEHRAQPAAPLFLRGLDLLPQLAHAGQHRRERDEA